MLSEILSVKVMVTSIKIRTPESLGCTLISTILYQSLREKFKETKIIVYTLFPDLLLGLNEIDEVINLYEVDESEIDIDLKGYLKDKTPQKNKPLRSLSEHIFEIAEGKLKEKLNRNFPIKINLSSEEIEKAKEVVNELSDEKRLVWLQPKTSTIDKDLNKGFWEELKRFGASEYSFVDLSSDKYERRLSIAITQQCDAGITLDTFLLHGSHAVNAKNVIALLVTSHKEVVCYPEQVVLKEEINPEMVLGNLKKLLD